MCISNSRMVSNHKFHFFVRFLFNLTCGVMSNVDDHYYDVLCFVNAATIKDTHTSSPAHEHRAHTHTLIRTAFTNTLSHFHSRELFRIVLSVPKQFFWAITFTYVVYHIACKNEATIASERHLRNVCCAFASSPFVFQIHKKWILFVKIFIFRCKAPSNPI